jgi:hypothetical protein
LSQQEVTEVMRHKREDVIRRAIQEFELLDRLVSSLSNEAWEEPLTRPETKDPWTVKDALAHITYWKSKVARSVKREGTPPEERGLGITDVNHLIYLRWRDRSPKEVLEWHQQVQEEVVTALQAASEVYFSSKERNPDWPGDLDDHSSYHRVKDIERALGAGNVS